MHKINWTGTMPAITTAFTENLEVDHAFTHEHVKWLVDQGCTGIVPHGSLGEGATLSKDEKIALQKTCVEAIGDKVPVIPGIAALTTAEAIELAKAAEDNGCKGLMVLPPYLYPSDWREMKAHLQAIITATKLPCLLYNNPVAYKTDFTPAQIAELANEHENVEAVKESSTDVRRVAAITELIGDRLEIGVGVDDCLIEGAAMGAKFWIAGCVSAFPRESIILLEQAVKGNIKEVMPLYHWMLPLLRMDTVVKFVQLIKLMQQEVGMGNERVRPPRLQLTGKEREETLQIIRHAIKTRPDLSQFS